MDVAVAGNGVLNDILADSRLYFKAKAISAVLTSAVLLLQDEGSKDSHITCTFKRAIAARDIITAVDAKKFESSLDSLNACSLSVVGHTRRRCPFSACLQKSADYYDESDTATFVVVHVIKGDGHKLCLEAIMFSCNGNAALCQLWLNSINGLLRRDSARPRSLLVFINPFGGKRRALHIYEKLVVPLFKACCIKDSVIVTERANHARDHILEAQGLAFDGAICVGGDGLFNEILFGLVVREQKRVGLNVDDRFVNLSRVPLKIGLIPAGSTNALVHTTHGTGDVVTAALNIILGRTRGIDVCSVHEGDNKLIKFASTAASYGYLGDTLQHSEKLRWMGPSRYSASGLKMLWRNRQYKGVVGFRLSPHADEDSGDCHSECALCALPLDDAGERVGNISEEHEIKSTFTDIAGVVTPCLCKLAPGGLSPHGHLGDGSLDILVVEKLSRWQNAMFVLRVLNPAVDHMKLNVVRTFRVSSFHFTPSLDVKMNQSKSVEDTFHSVVEADANHCAPGGHSADVLDRSKLSVWNIDGELVDQGRETTYFRVHRQLISLFARGIELAEKQKKRSRCCGSKKIGRKLEATTTFAAVRFEQFDGRKCATFFHAAILFTFTRFVSTSFSTQLSENL